MMSRPLIIELPAYGPSRGTNHSKTLRGPVGNGETGGTAQSYRDALTSLRHPPSLLGRLRSDVKLSVCVERRRRF